MGSGAKHLGWQACAAAIWTLVKETFNTPAIQGRTFMRIGWLAAAAATIVVAGQAQAATFVQYEARGTGFVLTQTTSGFDTRTGDFTFNFVIETDPGYRIGDTYGTGSQFVYQANRSDTFSASIVHGKLSINGQNVGTGGYGYGYTANINLPSFQLSYFNEIPNSTAAAGLVEFSFGTTRGGILYSGAINSLVKVGTVAGFIEPSVSVLPEPASWAMMIGGFGVVGGAMRRRNKVKTRVKFA